MNNSGARNRKRKKRAGSGGPAPALPGSIPDAANLDDDDDYDDDDRMDRLLTLLEQKVEADHKLMAMLEKQVEQKASGPMGGSTEMEQKDKMELVPSDQVAYDPLIWVKALSFALLLSLPAIVVSAFCHGEDFDEMFSEDPDLWIWIFVAAPMLVLIVIILVGMAKLQFKLGTDLLQECSLQSVDFKAFVVDSCSNTGTLGALFLGFCLAMLQVGNPPTAGTDLTVAGTMDIRSMWYTIYLTFASLLSLNAVGCSSIMLYYTGPLSERAALQFIVDNLNYMGDPMVSIGMAIVLTLNSMIIWLWQAVGHNGVMALMCVFIGFPGHGKLTGNFLYMSRWENHIDGPKDQEERIARIKMSDKVAGECWDVETVKSNTLAKISGNSEQNSSRELNVVAGG
eukprot:gnl/TRDRNA2_/TRDRNA2_89721_c0_seq1.p1 gnl/TRDRNA2_/TRDRNA2_89721_c0~~gnl/TRDRNA2_/TRDRNA2_89721_c0_seq1.p1  ORF type:complete len:397 (-),score=73.90 gnl/TRDRNA2_/TRDRNA2_89721_c0_seq1:101-1291(-)